MLFNFNHILGKLATIFKYKPNAGEDGEVTPSHILLGIWSEKESAGHKILASMGFTDKKAEELAKSVSCKFCLRISWLVCLPMTSITNSPVLFLVLQMDKEVTLNYK